MPSDGNRCTVTFPAIIYGVGPINHFGVTIAVNMNISAIIVIKNQAKLWHVTTM